MAAQAERPSREPPLEIVAEILLRLPPHEPACLLRASLVCKAWCGVVSGPGFRIRLHEFHRTPPVLGFLHNWVPEANPRFIPTTASDFSLAAPDCRSWRRALDCRHGRALFFSDDDPAQGLLVWEPITGGQRRVPVPAAFESDYGTLKIFPTAAVFCAADGCDHRGCHGGPFRLVFVFTVYVLAETGQYDEYDTMACVYSSETGAWGETTSTIGEFSFAMDFTRYSSVLVGRSALYFMSDDVLILEYDLAKHNLTVLDPPDYKPAYVGRFNIMLSQDGGLGVCQYLDPNLKLWTREASDGTDAQWVLSRVINLGNLLPIGSILDPDSRVQVMGFAEGANVMFFNTVTGIFIVELLSEKARKVCDKRGFCNLIPVVSFYTPVPRGEHQDPPSMGPSEEAVGEEGEEEEKAVEQTQQLFDKGSNTIKEGGLVNECDIEIRVPHYGEVAPECASMEVKHGHALPSEAQEWTDPLGEVPNRALDEELVKITSANSKDDPGNSKTSGSNVEDAAPASEKSDSEEVLLC